MVLIGFLVAGEGFDEAEGGVGLAFGIGFIFGTDFGLGGGGGV